MTLRHLARFSVFFGLTFSVYSFAMVDADPDSNPFPNEKPRAQADQKSSQAAKRKEYGITVHKGTIRSSNPFPNIKPREKVPSGVGATIAVGPKDDLAKPVAEFSITGYIKGDFEYDFNKDNIPYYFLTSAIRPAFNPSIVTPSHNHPHVQLFASETKYRIKSKLNSPIGEIDTWLEGDFYADPPGNGNELITNSNNFRLRLAYGEWFITPYLAFRAGQDYSTFSNLFAFPETLDFGGPVGSSQVRQGLARLSYQTDRFQVSIGVENPEGDFTTVGGGLIPLGTVCSESTNNVCGANDEVPDLAASIQYATPERFAEMQVAGVMRFLRAGTDKGQGVAFGYAGLGKADVGYGGLGALKINVNKFISAEGTFIGGHGLGRYLYDGGIGQGALFDSETSRISLVDEWGANGAIILHFTPQLRSNFVFGVYDASIPARAVGGINTEYTTHMNLIWQPIERLQLGGEGIWGRLYRVGSPSGEAFRLQISAWFFF